MQIELNDVAGFALDGGIVCVTCGGDDLPDTLTPYDVITWDGIDEQLTFCDTCQTLLPQPKTP